MREYIIGNKDLSGKLLAKSFFKQRSQKFKKQTGFWKVLMEECSAAAAREKYRIILSWLIKSGLFKHFGIERTE